MVTLTYSPAASRARVVITADGDERAAMLAAIGEILAGQRIELDARRAALVELAWMNETAERVRVNCALS